MSLEPLLGPAIATSTAVLAASATIWFVRGGLRARWLLPLSGGLLISLALVGLIPEVAHALGWARAFALVVVGYFSLHALDRAFHTDTVGVPLVAACAIHALVDGWGLVTVEMGDPHFAVSVTAAILLHKVPEGLALGTMLRTIAGTPARAMLLCLVGELPTLLGGIIGLWATPAAWVQYPLAFAAGTFLFLGVHALRANSKSLYRDSTF